MPSSTCTEYVRTKNHVSKVFGNMTENMALLCTIFIFTSVAVAVEVRAVVAVVNVHKPLL